MNINTDLYMDSFYIISAQKAEQLPAFELPEVAFMGRSNCGKSSLVNAITGRKNLARSSSTPGRTQMANFFGIDHKIILADLPGYGFSVAKKEISNLWESLIGTYVTRPNIKEFMFLMDCRRKFEQFEYEFMENLSQYTNVSLVLTKVDKVKKSEIFGIRKKFEKDLADSKIKYHQVAMISTLSKYGIEEMRKRLFEYTIVPSEGDKSTTND